MSKFIYMKAGSGEKFKAEMRDQIDANSHL